MIRGRWFFALALTVLAAEAVASYGLYQLAWWAVPVFWIAAGFGMLVLMFLIDFGDHRSAAPKDPFTAWEVAACVAVVVLSFLAVAAAVAFVVFATIENRLNRRWVAAVLAS